MLSIVYMLLFAASVQCVGVFIPASRPQRAPAQVRHSYTGQKLQIDIFYNAFVNPPIPEIPAIRPEQGPFHVLKTSGGKFVTFLERVEKAPKPPTPGGDPESEIEEEEQEEEGEIGIPWKAGALANVPDHMMKYLRQPYVRWKLWGLYETLLNQTVDLSYQQALANQNIPAGPTKTTKATTKKIHATTTKTRPTDRLFHLASVQYEYWFLEAMRTRTSTDHLSTVRPRATTSNDVERVLSIWFRTKDQDESSTAPITSAIVSIPTPTIHNEAYATLASIWAEAYPSAAIKSPTPTISSAFNSAVTGSISYTTTSTPVETITIMPLYQDEPTQTLTRYEVRVVARESGSSTLASCKLGVVATILVNFMVWLAL